MYVNLSTFGNWWQNKKPQSAKKWTTDITTKTYENQSQIYVLDVYAPRNVYNWYLGGGGGEEEEEKTSGESLRGYPEIEARKITLELHLHLCTYIFIPLCRKKNVENILFMSQQSLDCPRTHTGQNIQELRAHHLTSHTQSRQVYQVHLFIMFWLYTKFIFRIEKILSITITSLVCYE